MARLPSLVLLGCALHAALTLVAPSNAAAAPSITDVSLRGLEIGGTTVVAIRGTQLLPDPQLVMPLPVVRQAVRPGATAELVEFEVELDGKAIPGIVPLRVISGHGISNAVPVGADRIVQQPYADAISALPIALHGNVADTEIKTTTFQGRRGMRIVAEVESRRLGAALRPVVRILDERGRQLSFAPGSADLLGDSRCVVVLPADGTYKVQLHDALYRAPQPSYFRLKIGELDYAEAAFPLGIQRGQNAGIRLLARGKPADTVQITAPADYVDAWMPVRSTSPWFTGTAPRIAVSDHAELTEMRSGSDVQNLPALPIAVSGRLSADAEEDRYALDVQPGARLRIELFAQRVGADLDGVVIVRAEAGNELARGDDQPGTSDPGLDFTVPEGTTKIVVAVQDLQKGGGDFYIYRLAVRDLSEPAISLNLAADSMTLPQGARQTILVTAQRANFSGPIQLEVEGLPAAATVTGQRIPEGVDRALLTLSGDAPIAGPVAVRVRGSATAGEKALRPIARTADSIVNRLQPWYRDELALAGAGATPIALQWQTAEASVLPRGGKLSAKLQVVRGPAVTGKVRIRLLTTQAMPRKKIMENNQEKEVDDIERALRIEGDPVLEENAAETVASVLVPVDLPDAEWGLVFVAELLAADGQTVVATSTTTCEYRRPVTALALELSGETRITAKAGEGETGKFVGKLVRGPGYEGEVKLTLAGLPEGYPAPTMTVAADQQQFEFPIAFPAGAAAAELKNVQLYGELQSDPENVIRSASLPVEIVVAPGAGPSP